MNVQDQKSRLLAIDPTQSFCVSAPAGSGKTELLTQRLLSLLVTVTRPEQVLAITFTRKAASEMASRVAEKLEEARNATPIRSAHEATTRELALALLSHADRLDWQLDESTLNIRTIDSFCHEITRQMPIVSGVGGVTEPVDDATGLYERAVAQLLSQAGEQSEVGNALRLLLSQLDNRWMKVRELLVSLLARRGDWAPHVGQHHDPAGAKKTLIKTVSDLVCQRLATAKIRLTHQFVELGDVLNEAREALELPPLVLAVDAEALDDWRAMAAMLLTAEGDWRKPGGVSIRQGFEKGSETKRRFIGLLSDFSGDEELKELLTEMRHLPSIQTDSADWPLVIAISTLLPVLQAHLLLVFQQAGVVDHTHIALAASDALGPDDNPSAVAQRLDYQIEHILVDEFQDTSHSQAELLRRLTRDWSDHNATGSGPRTLFVVGDAMQSIYGFRYADVALFMRVQATGLSGLKLIPLTLLQNFRSRPAIVTWVNTAFSALMGEKEDTNKGSVKHVVATATRDSLTQSQEEGVQVALFAETDGPLESENVAARIAELRVADPESSIAILVRARSHATDITSALSARGIPFDGDALQSLSEQAVIQDLLSLCRWLENPADNVASIALMRSPWAGLSLTSIVILAGRVESRPFNLFEMFGSDETATLAHDEQLRLSALISALRWANSTRDRLALPIWVEQIWLRLGGPITVLPDDLPRVRLFFDALRRAEASGIGLNTDRIVDDLNSISLDSAAPSGSVRVLTLHKAKGLEFDYVFLPTLHKLPRANARELLRWHWHDGTSTAGLLIAADDQEKKAPTLYNYLNWLQKAKQHEELKRLLYVGITRARERVFLSGTVKTEEGKGERPAPAGSLLSLLQQITTTPITHEAAPAAGAFKSEHGAMGPGSDHNPGLYRIASAALAMPAVMLLAGDSEDLVRSRGISEHGDQENRAERSVGAITHRILERLTTNPSPLPSEMTDEILGWISTNALQANLTAAEAEHVQSACATLVANTLRCSIGRWLLSGHRDAHSELQVARIEAGEVRQYFIDRTFYDEHEGVRWIIDYKTSCPKPNEDEDSFKSRELMAYGFQLDTYADLLKNYGWEQQVPIKTALYFPAIQALAVHS